MPRILSILLVVLLPLVALQSCNGPGCTNYKAQNYEPKATKDDGSCLIVGCLNANAVNYNPEASQDDGSCIIYGCTNPLAGNYNPEATVDDGNCNIGELTFYLPTGAGYNTPLHIYIDGTFSGTIQQKSSFGTCGLSDLHNVTVSLPGDTYTLYVREEGSMVQNYEGSYSCYNGQCRIFGIF